MTDTRKIKMAAIGLRFGEHVVEQIVSGLANPTIELCGLCDLDAAKAERLAQQHKTRTYESLEEILQDPLIEAVGLFTPPAGRADLIRKIIRAGKHVMTTKPFELDAVAALAVLEEARSLGKVVHLNSPGPLPDAETAQILQWQEEFSLGQPVAVRWETYARYCEVADGNWYDDPNRCPVAPIFRLGIYGINQLLRLCGKVDAVSVMHSRLFTGRPTPDNAELSMQFSNGALGSIFASFCIDDGHRYSDTLCIHYERGTVTTRASGTDSNFSVTEKGLFLQARDQDGPIISRQIEMDGYGPLSNYQWEKFHRAVREGAPLVGEIDPEMVAHSIQVIDAVREADRTNTQIILSEPSLEPS